MKKIFLGVLIAVIAGVILWLILPKNKSIEMKAQATAQGTAINQAHTGSGDNVAGSKFEFQR